MSIQVLTLIFAVLIAITSAYLAYKDRTGVPRKIAVTVSLTAAFISSVLVYEEFTRKAAMDKTMEVLNREWILLQDAYVEAIEFEVVTDDGFFDLNDFLQRADKLSIEIEGIELNLGHINLGQATPLSAIFTFNNLKNDGRIGIGRAVVVHRGDRVIEEFKSVECLSSTYITELTQFRWNDKESPLVCSVAVRLPLKPQTLRLSDISGSRRIALTVTDQEGPKCIGICTGMLISTKLIYGRRIGNLETMIEISPQVHQNRPSLHTDTMNRFELSGQHVLSLVESTFKRSVGHRRREWFVFTSGAIHSLYQRLTTRSSTMRLVQIVWTTDSDPSLQDLLNAVPPSERSNVEPFRAEEWCGFGNRAVCWYRFLMFTPLPQ